MLNRPQLVLAAENGRAKDVLELLGGGANIEYKDHVRRFESFVSEQVIIVIMCF